MSREWRIGKIYTLSSKHENSYIFLKKYCDLDLRVISLDKYRFQNIRLFIIILWSKITSQNIYFFHECSWPIFDLLVKFINPVGCFLPQVSMNAFEKIDFIDIKKFQISSSKASFIRFFKTHFDIYTKKDDDSQKYLNLFLTLKKYPSKIKPHSIDYSNDIFKINNTKPKSKNRKILFFCDKDTIASEELIDYYNSIINNCIKLKFDCYIKQHPNKDFRLSINNDKCEVINPEIPAELLFNDYQIVIGTSSTALAYFNGVSISILNLFSDEYSKERTKKHFFGINKNNSVLFPLNNDQFLKIISNQ